MQTLLTDRHVSPRSSPRNNRTLFGAQDVAAMGTGGVHFVPQLDGSINPSYDDAPFQRPFKIDW
jgi:hypothetical protein